MEARAFTWFTKFGTVLDAVPEADQAEFALAIVRYGSFGEEPKFDNALLSALFISLKEDIDNSLTKRASANKGGRPTKKEKPQVKTGFDNSETSFEENAETGFEVSETSFEPNAETGFANTETTAYINQTSTNQSITSQRGIRASAPAPCAPSEEEAVAYFQANCIRGDPHAFFDFYESQGWLKGNGMPIANWKSQANQWHRKQVEIDAERKSRGRPTSQEVEQVAQWRPAETDEQALARLDAQLAALGGAA